MTTELYRLSGMLNFQTIKIKKPCPGTTNNNRCYLRFLPCPKQELWRDGLSNANRKSKSAFRKSERLNAIFKCNLNDFFP